MTMFRALLLASSLGWSFATPSPPQDYSHDGELKTDSYGPDATPYPSSSTRPSGYYDAGNSTSSSGYAESTRWYPPAPIVATMDSQTSLIVPTRTPKKAQTMKTQTSLSVNLPGIYTAHLEDPESSLDGYGGGSGSTIYATAIIQPSQTSLAGPGQTYFSPRTGVTQTSLAVPSPVRAHTDSGLDVPTKSSMPIYASPVKGVTEVSLDVPTGDGSGMEPTMQSQVYGGATPTDAPNPGAVFVSIISLINSYTKESGSGDSRFVIGGQTIAPGSQGVVVEGTTYSVAPTGNGGAVYVNGVETAATAVPGLKGQDAPGYVIEGQTIAPGSSGVVVEGTTYSAASTGGAVYVNGVETEPTAVPGLAEEANGLGGAIMSGIQNNGQEESTMSTSTVAMTGGSASASTYTPAQQTTSGSSVLGISAMSLGLGLLVCVML